MKNMLMQSEVTTKLNIIANVKTFFCRHETTHMEKLVILRHKRQL